MTMLLERPAVATSSWKTEPRSSTSPHGWHRGAYAIGSIRIRTKNGSRVRFIKVRMGGPRAGRWINFARWWWETNRGSVPEGKRVVHADGDSLNDDPSNYELMTAGDVVFLAHDRDPGMSRRNYAACRKATAAFNRQRAHVRRQTEWLPSKWYAVDVDGRRIFDEPYRKRNKAMIAHGMDAAAAAGPLAIAASLGWADLSSTSACVLAVLAASGATLDRDELLAHVRGFRQARIWMPIEISLHAFRCAIMGLARRGYVLVHRRGRRLGTYHIGRAAIDARGPVCPIVAICGAELQSPQFALFTRTQTEVIHRSPPIVD